MPNFTPFRTTTYLPSLLVQPSLVHTNCNELLSEQHLKMLPDWFFNGVYSVSIKRTSLRKPHNQIAAYREANAALWRLSLEAISCCVFKECFKFEPQVSAFSWRFLVGKVGKYEISNPDNLSRAIFGLTTTTQTVLIWQWLYIWSVQS